MGFEGCTGEIYLMKRLFARCVLPGLVAFLGGFACSLHAQLILVPLGQRLAVAELVIEGEVVRSESFYGNNRVIYTRHWVRVDRVAKGLAAADSVEVILEGGRVGDRMMWMDHHLVLAPGSSGVFFLNPLGRDHPAKLGEDRVAYDVYADLQGFIAYLRQAGATVGAEPFHIYRDIGGELYPLLGWAGEKAPVKHKVVPPHALGAPVIDSIRPLQVTAGTRTELSIYGHGFLAGKGVVYFRDANTGGVTEMMCDTADVKEWTDTLIRVWVPSIGALPLLSGIAGTGFVKMENAAGDTARSLETLQVMFGIRNVRNEDSLFPIGVARFASLFDLDAYTPTDTSGGYTFRFSQSFSANDSAVAVFRRSLQQWRCATGVNFKVGADTSLNVLMNDFVNIVRWDDFPDTLPAGRLALTRLYFVDCVDGSEHAYQISEIDFTFNRNFPWNFDTTAVPPTQVDFYSVSLHEIGHAHGLTHVIDNNELMDYNIDIGQRSASISIQSLEGGTWMMDSSTVARGNCYDPMAAVAANDCETLPVAPSLEDGLRLRLYPNPTTATVFVELMGANAIHEIDCRLMDAAGNCIATSRFSMRRMSSTTYVVDLSDLPSGLYFARMHIGKVQSCQKIMKMR